MKKLDYILLFWSNPNRSHLRKPIDGSTTIDFMSIRPLLGFKRWMFLIRNRIGKIISPWRNLPIYGFHAYRLDSARFVKFGASVRPTEAQAMDYVAKHTKIPVPRLLDVFKLNGTVNIVQEFIDCPVLQDVWPQLCDEDRLGCMKELKGYLDQLRALLPPDPDVVQAIDGSGCQDLRLKSDGVWGPFATHHEFQVYIGYEFIRRAPEIFQGASERLAKIQGRMWRTVFSHGDLGPHNILWNVKKKRIAAIIDWECSGWLPEYWDYCRAGTFAKLGCPSWWDLFNQVMDTYPDEFSIEQLIEMNFERY